MHYQKHLNKPHILLTLLIVLISPLALATTATPVSKNGHLSINSVNLVNQQGNKLSLAGPSMYWSTTGWPGEKFYTEETINSVIKQFNPGVIRAALGVEGKRNYMGSPKQNLARINTVIKAAIDNGIYVIIDWHSHKAHQDPEAAIEFFKKMAKQYGHLPNIIYEIYNEPLPDADWSTVIKPYSERVIEAIRSIDPDNLIIVGTQSWSQDVDKVIDDPIKNNKNIAYALHFYAGTHKQKFRDKAQLAIDAGLALFVSEWSSVNADGGGAIDYKETQLWLDFMRKNSLSHCSWSISAGRASSSIFNKDVSVTGPWQESDFSENGRLLKYIIQQWQY